MATFKYPLSKLLKSEDLTLKLQTHELPDWKGRIRFAAELKYLAKPPNKGKTNKLSFLMQRQITFKLSYVKKNDFLPYGEIGCVI